MTSELLKEYKRKFGEYPPYIGETPISESKYKEMISKAIESNKRLILLKQGYWCAHCGSISFEGDTIPDGYKKV
jgi:hypothetical protein